MMTSESIAEIAAALAKAQTKIGNVERDRAVQVTTKKGDKYSFTYATLAACLDACRGPLAENGVVIIQGTETDGKTVTVTTRLAHSSGQWIESTIRMRIPTDKDDSEPGPQAVGSALTYARRYGLCSMVGLASEEDDDGNLAEGNTVTKREANPACPKCGKPDAMTSTRGGPKYYCNPAEYKGRKGCGNAFDVAGAQEQKGNGGGAPAAAAKKAEPEKEPEKAPTCPNPECGQPLKPSSYAPGWWCPSKGGQTGCGVKLPKDWKPDAPPPSDEPEQGFQGADDDIPF